jgi:DNA ligase D-like protein (predicted 3'-phosphoesterase)
MEIRPTEVGVMPDVRSLDRYHAKRDFSVTGEPRGGVRRRSLRGGRSFVVQKHDARRLHYDFRLEHDGLLLSWAVPKGPSLDPKDRRLAVQTEDHPLDYRDFEGTIPEKQYGAGPVVVWDRGTWTPISDPDEGLQRGRLDFESTATSSTDASSSCGRAAATSRHGFSQSETTRGRGRARRPPSWTRGPRAC